MIAPNYSDPIVNKAKELLDNPPKILEYNEAVKQIVAHFMDGINERIDKVVASNVSKERV